MDPITQQTTLAAAGGKKDPLYVDDVFSTFLYDGTGSAQTITNGIDLAGEGGLVWIKNRENQYQDHALFDTERGAGYVLYSNQQYAQSLSTNRLSALNSNGFTVGSDTATNETGKGIASWTFRKAPGFFDVVTYTGSGSAQSISHSLGSVPGMILIKCTSHASDWSVYHRSMGATKNMHLNTTAAADTQIGPFNNTEPTATNFTVNYDGDVNGSGKTYVAYIFAHDDAQYGTDEDESIIHCGTYNGTGSPFDIDIGFEAQWVMYKRYTTDDNWYIIDNMRGLTPHGMNSRSLKANLTDAENGSGNYPAPYANGFRVITGSQNQSGHSYIYMAIRRPNKPPETATDVFAIDTRSGTSPTPPTYKSGFPVDWVWERAINTTNNWSARTRLTGNGKEFDLNLTGAEGSNSNTRIEFDRNDGLGTDTTVDSNRYTWMFKRAPGFFDVVAYTGTGSATTINHNLGVVPEMILTKERVYGENWGGYFAPLGATKNLSLNIGTSGGASTDISYWNDTAPTSSVFTVGSSDPTNGGNGRKYVAYLFATLPGISKVGSYTGNGTDQTIDCGFTNGARFVLIRRSDAGGNWYLWDSTRGIVSGNDPYLFLNSSAAQVTNTDYIDPHNSGFTLTAAAAASGGDLNYTIGGNGNSYVFFAIA